MWPVRAGLRVRARGRVCSPLPPLMTACRSLPLSAPKRVPGLGRGTCVGGGYVVCFAEFASSYAKRASRSADGYVPDVPPTRV